MANATFNYPLEFQFRLVALSPQFSIKDAQGRNIAYIRQKAFKWKEDVSVFQDETRSNLVFTIKADRWLDWSAVYNFSDSQGNHLGKIGRKGSRSLFKAHYELFDPQDKQDILIQEESVTTRVLDSLLGEIPVLGLFTGYAFNPKYNASRPDGTKVAQLIKKPSLFGQNFQLKQLATFEEREELRILLGFTMLVLLERSRG